MGVEAVGGGPWMAKEWNGPEALGSLRPQWEELHQACGGGRALSWDRAVQALEAEGARGLPRLLAVHAEGHGLAGLLPLREQRLGWPVPCALWSLLVSAGGEPWAPLVRAGAEGPVQSTLVDELLRARGRWDLLELSDLAADGPFCALLCSRALARGLRLEVPEPPAGVSSLIRLVGTARGRLRRGYQSTKDLIVESWS